MEDFLINPVDDNLFNYDTVHICAALAEIKSAETDDRRFRVFIPSICQWQDVTHALAILESINKEAKTNTVSPRKLSAILILEAVHCGGGNDDYWTYQITPIGGHKCKANQIKSQIRVEAATLETIAVRTTFIEKKEYLLCAGISGYDITDNHYSEIWDYPEYADHIPTSMVYGMPFLENTKISAGKNTIPLIPKADGSIFINSLDEALKALVGRTKEDLFAAGGCATEKEIVTFVNGIIRKLNNPVFMNAASFAELEKFFSSRTKNDITGKDLLPIIEAEPHIVSPVDTEE